MPAAMIHRDLQWKHRAKSFFLARRRAHDGCMEFLSALAAIVVIDLVLAGDNAIVIALAARSLLHLIYPMSKIKDMQGVCATTLNTHLFFC